jgi:hypothetical protein
MPEIGQLSVLIEGACMAGNGACATARFAVVGNGVMEPPKRRSVDCWLATLTGMAGFLLRTILIQKIQLVNQMRFIRIHPIRVAIDTPRRTALPLPTPAGPRA